MKIAIGCDHGAYMLKEIVKQHLLELGHEVCDFGCFSQDSVDYPDYAFPTAKAVSSGAADKGIVLCTTGIGVSICANKVKGIRCSLCFEERTAELTRRHNDSNMLALGAGFISTEQALAVTDTWLTTEFDGGRHQRRIDKISDYENGKGV